MRFKIVTSFAFFIVAVILFSCSGSSNKKQQDNETSLQKSAEPVKINAEAQALLDYLAETGDYANSRNFPSLIKASSVYEELNSNDKIQIVDLRGPESFAKGHIKGAVRVEFNDIPDYFQNRIKPFEYDKIILVCYSGQVSSYAVSLLRLMGYGNVYALRWGMSSWNKVFAYHWFDVVSGKYENKLDSVDHEKAPMSDLPIMNTGKNSGEEILDSRFRSLFNEDHTNAVIFADSVFAHPEKYYIINYDRRDKYESGHIPGAIRYKPNGTLGIVSEMESIPTDREIVVYCGTGHNSGFVTAYLRLFGYNAKTLIYGNNSFMYNKMLKDEKLLSWLPFTEAEIENYSFEK